MGYVRLTDFNETTACRPGEGDDCERELERALRELEARGREAFVLDIRDNPGGLLDQAFAVSNLFLKKGQLVVFTRGRSRRDESNYITETESPWSSVPAGGADLAPQRERLARSWPGPCRTTTAR